MPRRRGFGDAIDDILAGKSDGLTQTPTPGPDSLLTPSWASSSSSAPPVRPTQGNNPSSWSWGDLAKNLVAGIVQGVSRPATPAVKPTALLGGSSSSSMLPLVLGGAAALGVLVFIMRRREA